VTGSLPPQDPRDALTREQAALIAGLSAQVTDLPAPLAELTGLVRELRGQLDGSVTLPCKGCLPARRPGQQISGRPFSGGFTASYPGLPAVSHDAGPGEVRDGAVAVPAGRGCTCLAGLAWVGCASWTRHEPGGPCAG
jgi:hypothetical protein